MNAKERKAARKIENQKLMEANRVTIAHREYEKYANYFSMTTGCEPMTFERWYKTIVSN